MATAVKRCPVCGRSNGLVADRCGGCAADLAGVMPAVEPLHNDAAPPGPVSDPQPASGAEIGETTADHGLVADAPGSAVPASSPAPPLSAPPPAVAPQAQATSDDVLVLELVADPRVRLQIRSGETLGRGRDADVQLAGFDVPIDISRVHAEFARRPTGWYVRHLGHTNFIQLDGRQHRDPETQLRLVEGAVLSLTATPFVVRLATGGSSGR